jgi:hypothetical protein
MTAKKKKSETPDSRRLKNRLKNMSTKKRKRKSTAPRSRSARPRSTRRRTTRARSRKRTRALSAGGGGGGKVGLMKAGQNTLAAGIGAALYTGPQMLIKLPLWAKALIGTGIGVGGHMMKFPNIASGAVGAMTFDLLQQVLGAMLNDDMMDTEYVDPSLLSDTGYCDRRGNSVVMDDDGIVYALNDDGDYEATGGIEDLQKMYGASALQSVSMLPLQDNSPFALSQGNPFALNDIYSLSDNGYALASGYNNYNRY